MPLLDGCSHVPATGSSGVSLLGLFSTRKSAMEPSIVDKVGRARLLLREVDWYQLGERGTDAGPAALERRLETDGLPVGVLRVLEELRKSLRAGVVEDAVVDVVLVTLTLLPLRGRPVSSGDRRWRSDSTPSLL